jgi:Flp pilus assembly protein TadG
MAGVMVVLATLAIGAASLGSLYAARAQAHLASDAAALAAAPLTYPGLRRGSPVEEAATMATINGATLERCICPIDSSMRVRTAEVTVSVSRSVPIFGSLSIRATSRAEFDPRVWLGR